jgi:hypothetical protein
LIYFLSKTPRGRGRSKKFRTLQKENGSMFGCCFVFLSFFPFFPLQKHYVEIFTSCEKNVLIRMFFIVNLESYDATNSSPWKGPIVSPYLLFSQRDEKRPIVGFHRTNITKKNIHCVFMNVDIHRLLIEMASHPDGEDGFRFLRSLVVRLRRAGQKSRCNSHPKNSNAIRIMTAMT